MVKKPETTLAGASPGAGAIHPHPPHDQDTVVVEVLWPKGVKDDGKVYHQGQLYVTKRGHARGQNAPGRQVLRVVRTVLYYNGPEVLAEESVGEGPLELSD